jgi:hypothetical protein
VTETGAIPRNQAAQPTSLPEPLPVGAEGRMLAPSRGGPMRLLHWLSGFVRAWRGQNQMAIVGPRPG